jgi:hypothetical protein
MSFKIEKLTAFVSVGEDGEEGIIGGMLTPGQWMPFIGADEQRIAQLYELTVEMCQNTGTKFKVLQFDNRVDVTEEIIKKYKDES